MKIYSDLIDLFSCTRVFSFSIKKKKKIFMTQFKKKKDIIMARKVYG